MAFDWDDIAAYGAALAGVERATHYRMPALKVNGHFFASYGHSPQESFVLALPLDLVELAKDVEPGIFYQTPHYEGWPSVLVRFSADFAEVTGWIDRAHAEALAKKPKTPRKT